MSNGEIFKNIPRCDDAVIEQIRGASVADLHDAVGADWRALTLMRAVMRPVVTGVTVAGRAVTAWCPSGDNMMMHTALHLAQHGDVLVVANGGVPNGALWGENAAIAAAMKGVAGIIVDGPVRDTAALRARGYPTWSSSISVSTPGKSRLGAVNVPIDCGGVLVYPGDVIVADDDGVIALRPAWIPDIAARVRARSQKDAAMQALVARGGSIFEVLQIEAALRDMGAVIQDRAWSEAGQG